MSGTVRTVNPASAQTLREFSFAGPDIVESSIAASAEAFRHWRALPLRERRACVADLANGLQAAQMTLAELITEEMGKLSREAVAEVNKGIAACRYLHDHFEDWMALHQYAVPGGYSVHVQPLGPLLGIMPWNFPLWQVLRFAVPALLCGNTILLKHAPSTWGCAELIEDIFRQAFPDGVYQGLSIDVPLVEGVIADRRVRGVSLTGSVRAGQSVGRLAGAHLKKCVLELGGSDAYVILDDADIEAAAEICVASRLLNAGQSCISAKRFVVTRKNSVQFTEALRARLALVKWGDPSLHETGLAPLARVDLRDVLAEQVERSRRAGARVVVGGAVPDHPGFFYPATLLDQVRPGQAAFDEELFGPVAAVVEAADERQALALANHTSYGLGGAIFSRDRERAMNLAITEMESGMVAVNDYVRSDVAVPFGGVKDSGVGRELGREGAFEFVNIKTVYTRS